MDMFRTVKYEEINSWIEGYGLPQDPLDPYKTHSSARLAVMLKAYEEANGGTPQVVDIVKSMMYENIVSMAADRGFTVVEVGSEPLGENDSRSYVILM